MICTVLQIFKIFQLCLYCWQVTDFGVLTKELVWVNAFLNAALIVLVACFIARAFTGVVGAVSHQRVALLLAVGLPVAAARRLGDHYKAAEKALLEIQDMEDEDYFGFEDEEWVGGTENPCEAGGSMDLLRRQGQIEGEGGEVKKGSEVAIMIGSNLNLGIASQGEDFKRGANEHTAVEAEGSFRENRREYVRFSRRNSKSRHGPIHVSSTPEKALAQDCRDNTLALTLENLSTHMHGNSPRQHIPRRRTAEGSLRVPHHQNSPQGSFRHIRRHSSSEISAIQTDGGPDAKNGLGGEGIALLQQSAEVSITSFYFQTDQQSLNSNQLVDAEENDTVNCEGVARSFDSVQDSESDRHNQPSIPHPGAPPIQVLDEMSMAVHFAERLRHRLTEEFTFRFEESADRDYGLESCSAVSLPVENTDQSEISRLNSSVTCSKNELSRPVRSVDELPINARVSCRDSGSISPSVRVESSRHASTRTSRAQSLRRRSSSPSPYSTYEKDSPLDTVLVNCSAASSTGPTSGATAYPGDVEAAPKTEETWALFEQALVARMLARLPWHSMRRVHLLMLTTMLALSLLAIIYPARSVDELVKSHNNSIIDAQAYFAVFY